jgi:hypothetical protein
VGLLAGPGSIALLLALASPQQYPPLLLQPGLARFYGGAPARPLPPGLPAVSVHGGSADLQVTHAHVLQARMA